MEVQSILFAKNKFDIREAKKWLKSHKFRNIKIDEKEKYYRFRQKDPNLFLKNSSRTIKNNSNVIFIIGIRKNYQR